MVRDKVETATKRLRLLAEDMFEEADNLSPSGGTHPVPEIRKWAGRVIDIANRLEKKD